MRRDRQITLLKSTNNTDLLQAVLKQTSKEDKILLLANKKSDFLKDSLESLRKNMVEFDSLYTQIRCMFLKRSWDELDKRYGKSAFITELESLSEDEEFSTLCFHRLDTLLDCISKQECELLIAEIIKTAYQFDKKVIFTINNKSELGQLLESILSDLVDEEKQIDKSNTANHKQLVLLNATNNMKLIKSALNLHQKDGNLLFLANSETIFLRDSFKALQKEMTDFDKLYALMRCMFLKDDWSILDKRYGKVFFIYEIQNLIKNRNFSTIYFHRLDKLFAGASFEDCQQLLTDIKDFARYYHKKIIFSVDADTQLGELLMPLLQDTVDYEYILEESCDNCIKKATQQPINLILHQPLQNRDNRVSL